MEDTGRIITVIAGFAFYHYTEKDAFGQIRKVLLSYKYDNGITESTRRDMMRAAAYMLSDLRAGCPVLWDREPPETKLATEQVQARERWYIARSGPGSNNLQEATYE